MRRGSSARVPGESRLRRGWTAVSARGAGRRLHHSEAQGSLRLLLRDCDLLRCCLGESDLEERLMLRRRQLSPSSCCWSSLSAPGCASSAFAGREVERRLAGACCAAATASLTAWTLGRLAASTVAAGSAEMDMTAHMYVIWRTAWSRSRKAGGWALLMG